jgi:hypothetical protein
LLPLEELKRHSLPTWCGPPPLGREPLFVFSEHPLGVDPIPYERPAAKMMDKKGDSALISTGNEVTTSRFGLES